MDIASTQQVKILFSRGYFLKYSHLAIPAKLHCPKGDRITRVYCITALAIAIRLTRWQLNSDLPTVYDIPEPPKYCKAALKLRAALQYSRVKCPLSVQSVLPGYSHYYCHSAKEAFCWL